MVLFLLAEAANHHPEKGHDGQIAWLSRATLAAWGGISESTVKRAFRTLEDLGLIVNLGCNHPGTEATVYRVNISATATEAQRPTQLKERPHADRSPPARPSQSAPLASDTGPSHRIPKGWSDGVPITDQPGSHEQRLPLRAA